MLQCIQMEYAASRMKIPHVRDCAISCNIRITHQLKAFKGGRMGRSDKVSLWCVSLLINTRFRFFILE